VVGGLALEHFGGLQFAETDNNYAATGRAATTHVWGWPNPLAIEEATSAIRGQNVPRAINIVPARPGVNGGVQLNWLGGGFSRHLVDLGGWPGWHISGDWPSAGFQAYYPSAKTRISTDVFLKQTAAAVQLVNALMTKDVIALAPAWGYLQVGVTTLGALRPGAGTTRRDVRECREAAAAPIGEHAQSSDYGRRKGGRARSGASGQITLAGSGTHKREQAATWVAACVSPHLSEISRTLWELRPAG
jgi:hypothetical protein